MPQPRNQTTKPLLLKEQHEAILKAVYKYRFVTALDITNLFFSRSSLSHAREYLASLCGGGDYQERSYLYRFPLPSTKVGNSEKIYTLGAKGRAFLQAQGIEVDWYFRPAETNALTYSYLLHPLALTRFLVASQVFVRTHQNEVALPRSYTEYDLKRMINKDTSKREAMRVTIAERHNKENAGQKRLTVIPDAWLEFHFPHTPDPYRPVLLEIDRGTEQQQNFKRRLLGRLAFIKKNGPYFHVFNTNYVTVAYATTNTDERLKVIRHWTEEVLIDTGKEAYADVFRFCRLPTGELNPETLFAASSWQQPFAAQSFSLLSE